MCIRDLFFNFFWKIIKEKDWSDPQPDSAIQPKARGPSIWSASTSRTIYNQDFGAWAPHSLGATRSTWRTTQRIWRKDQKQQEGRSNYLKYSKTPDQVLDACRTRLRRARGLVRPGATRLLIGIECSWVRDSSWMYLTHLVITQIGVN